VRIGVSGRTVGGPKFLLNLIEGVRVLLGF